MSYEEERVTLQDELQKIQFLAAQKIQLTQEYAVKQEALRNYVQSLQENYKQALEKIKTQQHTIDITLKNVIQKKTELEKASLLKTQDIQKIEQEKSASYHSGRNLNR